MTTHEKTFVILVRQRFLKKDTPKRFMKEKTDKLNFIKMRNFCYLKDIAKRMKRQATKWKKISAEHLSDKGPVSRINRNLTTIQ